MPKSLADLFTAARQMAAALTANAETMAGRGVSADFIQRGQELAASLEAADVEQERLKAELKAASANVEALKKDLNGWLGEANSAVKLAYRGQQEKWVEFGVTAKR